MKRNDLHEWKNVLEINKLDIPWIKDDFWNPTSEKRDSQLACTTIVLPVKEREKKELVTASSPHPLMRQAANNQLDASLASFRTAEPDDNPKELYEVALGVVGDDETE
jgi:hypothetical protein